MIIKISLYSYYNKVYLTLNYQCIRTLSILAFTKCPKVWGRSHLYEGLLQTVATNMDAQYCQEYLCML